MYTTAKRISVISIILAAFNILATFLFLLHFPDSGWSFAIIFMTGLFLVTASAMSIMMTIAMRSLTQDLELEYESSSKKLRELSKRMESLEKLHK